MTHARWIRFTRLATAVAALGLALPGCAALFMGGAVIGSGLVATDRRTTGTQIEDESIELKAASRARDLATLGRINIVSYNRTVLIAGEVPGEPEKAAVERAVTGVENVRLVVNELAVMPGTTMGTRSSDTLLGARVKATMIDAKDVQAHAFKVVVERGIVYLMGRVTEREAARGADLARSVSGVQKVVRVFEILTEEQLAGLSGPQAPAAAAAAASAPK
ncbi:MAG: BON domain-containing protein [Rubrivivax sp.]|nr:BON domain-containing protein [Rubrivivax sp.]